MASGPDRRTFVRGAAGAVGLGAVGGLSPRDAFAGHGRPPAPVKIRARLEPLGKGGAMKLTCPSAVAERKQEVEWSTPGNLLIRLIQFKGGRTPFSQIEFRGSSQTIVKTVPDDAAPGGYSYLIVAQDNTDKTYALDPDLDII